MVYLISIPEECVNFPPSTHALSDPLDALRL